MGDPKGTILKSYAVRWPIIGIAKRVTYIIGKDRRILHAFHSERSMTAHAEQACEFVARRAR